MNIYHRKDGRWEGRLPMGKDKKGTRKYQYFFGSTREEVQEKMKDAHFIKSNNTITVMQLFKEWHLSIRHHRAQKRILTQKDTDSAGNGRFLAEIQG